MTQDWRSILNLKIKQTSHSAEENIEFLQKVKPFYKISKPCNDMQLDKANVYNMMNQGSLKVRGELVNELVYRIKIDLLEAVKDDIEIVDDD